MRPTHIVTLGRQVLVHVGESNHADPRRIVRSAVFAKVVRRYVEHLQSLGSPLVRAFPEDWLVPGAERRVVQALRHLLDRPLSGGEGPRPDALAELAAIGDPGRLRAFIDGLYDWWRAHDRLMLIHADAPPAMPAYDVFARTVESFNQQVRTLYRIVRDHAAPRPVRTYRQLAAGCGGAMVVSPLAASLPPGIARAVEGIPCARAVWMAPPLLLSPSPAKRSGGFLRLTRDPMPDLVLDRENWFCYPAQVGPLVVLAYVHARFASMGLSLGNLFELADDRALGRAPDAVCFYGVPESVLPVHARTAPSFFDDGRSPLIGLVPDTERFGYFGYLKKTMLLLHNVAMMHRRRLPFHGAMLNLELDGGRNAGLLLVGDTGTGKSETIEALRRLADPRIRAIEIVADDMGSLEVDADGRLLAFGTETGAFVRLDDLERSYAFQALDRAVFMNPQAENARVVLPVTNIQAVLRGTQVDLMLYANNYEAVDGDHPALDMFSGVGPALRVFRDGVAMSKGTTTSTGLVRNYFANIFGPPAYRELHESLAQDFFSAAFAGGVRVGQLRTQLGLPSQGVAGPGAAAMAVLEALVAGRPMDQG